MTRLFLTISDGVQPQKVCTKLAPLLRAAAKRVLSEPDIDWQLTIDPSLDALSIDPQQLFMAVSQVLTNAVEAMPAGGQIRIDVDRSGAPPSMPSADDPALEKKYVRLRIQDQGCGIPEENLPFIFTPYYSTKERGKAKGLGLGLSMTFAVIRKHGGHLSVHSREGEGTRADIYLRDEAVGDR